MRTTNAPLFTCGGDKHKHIPVEDNPIPTVNFGLFEGSPCMNINPRPIMKTFRGIETTILQQSIRRGGGYRGGWQWSLPFFLGFRFFL